jgi:hypothetical protein
MKWTIWKTHSVISSFGTWLLLPTKLDVKKLCWTKFETLLFKTLLLLRQFNPLHFTPPLLLQTLLLLRQFNPLHFTPPLLLQNVDVSIMLTGSKIYFCAQPANV